MPHLVNEEQHDDAQANLPAAEEQRVGPDAEQRTGEWDEELADNRHFREQREQSQHPARSPPLRLGPHLHSPDVAHHPAKTHRRRRACASWRQPL